MCNFRLLGVAALSQQTAGYEPFEREVVLAGTTKGPSRGIPTPFLDPLPRFGGELSPKVDIPARN